MLITSKTTSPSVTNSDDLIISIPLIIPGIKTHSHEYSINISEPRILSPRYSTTGVVTGGGIGIGLGFVAALDKFGSGTSDSAAAAAATSVRSMYCNGGNIEDERSHTLKKWRQVGVFYESPSPIFYSTRAVTRDYPTSDFLTSCYLCRKKLHGKDIYMYRGEKAFCSPECRNQQIAADEREDKKRLRCRNGVSRSSFDVSSSAGASPYLEDHLFSTGIMAI